MREIKFRAWFEKEHRWLCGYEYGHEGCNILGEMILLGGFVMQDIHLKDLNDVIVEQFTGLKDKNGREIYEGDAIKHPEGHISMVEWVAELYAFDFGKSTCVTDQEEGCVKDGEVEVVGNIHENPELLKSH